MGYSTSILLKSVEAFNACENRHATILCQMFLNSIQQEGLPKWGTALWLESASRETNACLVWIYLFVIISTFSTGAVVQNLCVTN